MRTTVRLDDQLLKDAKAAAAESGRTFTDFVSDALRERLARRRAHSKRDHVPLPTWKGALRPGVNLDDSAGLLDLMEAPDDPS